MPDTVLRQKPLYVVPPVIPENVRNALDIAIASINGRDAVGLLFGSEDINGGNRQLSED